MADTPAPAPANSPAPLSTLPQVPLMPGLTPVPPPGWELTTQTMRPIPAATAAVASPPGGITPTATVMSASVATMFAPMLTGVLAAVGHPLPVEAVMALPTLFAFIGGWLHKGGRS